MSGLFLLAFGLLGQWLLGVAAAHLLLRSRSRAVSGSTEETPWAELAGLGLVLGIGLTAWGLFVWSLCGGMLGRSASLTFTVLGFVCGGPILWVRLRSEWSRHSRAVPRKSPNQPSAIEIDERRDAAWSRLCQWLIGGLTVIALAQTLLTPHRFWDERSIFAIKGLVLSADGSIRSPDLLDPDFVQYHPRYPLLIPLAEQHVYALLGGVDDRLSKIVFPLLYLGLVLTMAGVLSRRVLPGAAWLFALLLATVPVLMPYELGFLSGQADAPMACFHGLALLYLWDAYETDASGHSHWLGSSIIAGLCGALAAFTKDEGIAFLLVDSVALGLIVITRRARLCAAVPLVSVVVCAVIVLAPWFVHRRGLPLTTEMDYFGRASLSLVIERLPVLAWEMGHLAHRMLWEWPHWGLHWWLMLVGLVTAPRRVWSASQMVLLLDVVGSLLALMVAGMLAPAQLDEHIGGSSPRFLMQLVPVAVLFAAGQLAPRRETRVSSEPAKLV